MVSMRGYKVLLVDDEEDVFQVIMRKIDWESLGFTIAGYARNGVEALELAEELQPDVVMTDIKMPYMDGLTLCRKLKEQYQNIKVIIFSGFDEFEYAKEAIKIEAEEYILKPVNSNELIEVFKRIKNNLDKELDEQRNIDKLREYYMKSLPVLQESFYTALIEDRIPEEQIEKYALNYQVELDGPYYVIAILHISKHQQEDMLLDPFFLAVSVKRLAEEQLTQKWKSKILTYLSDVLVIAQLPEMESITTFTDEMDRFCKMAKRVCSATVTAGIGYVCNQLAQLSLSYNGARNAVSYRVLYGNTRAINIVEMEPQESLDRQWEATYIERILKKVKIGEQEPLEKAIREFTDCIAAAKMSMQNYRTILMELLAEIFRFLNNNHIEVQDIFESDNDIYNQALQLDSTEALKDWLIQKCVRMQSFVTNERRDTTKSFVTKAVEYVKDNFADKELSIDTVCSFLNVSAAYFSTVFKKETGKTFINYLTDYRMEQAVELLLSRDEKTYVIAEKVGYSDPNYFSYVFKKQFGMSPSKYKAAKLGKS